MRAVGLAQRHDFQGRKVRFAAPGDGPPVVLVHGTPFSSHVWHRIAPLLAHERRVFLYDPLGCGQSLMRPGRDHG